jgi:glycosyltransferase involved in cell wall biosynthesis
MMHVAIICKTFLKGGAEKQALILTKLLVDKGIDVILVNWYGEKVDQRNLKFISDNSIRYYPMNGSYLKKLNKFQKIIKLDEISIIVSYLTLANFVSGVSKLYNRNVLTIGGIRNEKLPYYKFLFEKLIHNYLNDATVFNNYSAKAKFERRGFNPDKIYVIQNAIELKNTQLNSKSSNGEIKIVTVGRFVKQKDYETALKSFSNLVERNRNREFKYYIVGYGPLEKDVRSMAEQLKIDNKIKVFINPPDVHGILKNSDIFLSTSLFEGVSNSIMEALVAGLPVVATNVGDNSYLVKDGHNGYLVPCKDVDTIVDKLEYLSGSQEVRNEFGKNSIKVVETEFSKTRLLDSYLSLFSKLQ